MLTADRFLARLRPPAGAPVRAVAAAGVAVSFLLLAGCGGGGGGGKATAAPASSPTATADDFGCLSPEQAKAHSVTFPSSSGQDVEAFADGTGHTALILTHQADGDVCQWVPHAMELAKDGYKVVAVDSVGDDVAEVTAAVTWARAKGATKVLLVGASKGGTAVLEAAGSITPPVDGVVSLSAPTSYGTMDAASAVPKLTMPVFYMASDLDSQFADAAKELHRTTKKAKENDLTIVDGTNHGVSMLNDGTNYTKVKDFLKKYGS
ncbi:alpha/beta hydrolase family protein [Streptomyces sp. NPDC020917]|uniref:alpha/beta hydrolase family protein n=1 Tax=Streptomyces sp. NPDC020917 TaxID=3365102 RepID=UPI003798C5FD